MTKLEELRAVAKHFMGLKNEVEKITSSINPVEIVTPVNYQEVRQKWIEKANKGFFINPVFRYDEAYLKSAVQTEYDLKALLEKLKKTNASSCAENFYLGCLEDVVYDTILTVEMAQMMLKRDHYGLAQVVLKKYGEADASLVQFAKSLARNGFVKETGIKLNDDLKKLRETQFDATSIAEFFSLAMERYQEFSQEASVWPVEILDNCSAIDVRDKNSRNCPSVVIPKTRRVNGIKLAELIGHEIECHWRHSQNARLIGLPKFDDETIYEGVAKMKDYRFNERYNAKVSMPIPYYVLAQQYAYSGTSFAETANYLTEQYDLSPEKTWTYTYRTFRGTSDTSNSACYAFTKDRAYLEGFLYVQRTNVVPESKAFLNFGTLSKKQLEKLSKILNYEEAEEKTLPDLDFQKESIRLILNRI